MPGTTQGIRDTVMTQWSLALIAKPVDVTDKKAELRHRGHRNVVLMAQEVFLPM